MNAPDDEVRAKVQAIVASWSPEQHAEIMATVEWMFSLPPAKLAAGIRYLLAPEVAA